MNDDRDDDDRTSRRTVPPPAPPATTSDGLRPPPLGDPAPVPQDAAQSGFGATAFGRDDYGFSCALATATLPGDMYVVPFGLENGVTVGMPGYVPMDPTSSIFQSLPSISAMQSSKFYPHPAGKHQTGNGDLKDDRLFQLMTSSSSSLQVPPPIGGGYSQHYEPHQQQQQQQQQQQDIGGYGEMTSMMVMERAGQPAAVGGAGGSFLPRCFGTADMLTGYAPMQPPPASAYCDGDNSVLHSYGAAPARPSLDQLVNFDVDASQGEALPSGSFPKPLAASSYSLVGTAGGEPRSTHPYNQHLQHHEMHQQLAQQHQPTSLQSQYRLPYPAQQPPPPQQQKSPTPQPPRCDVTSGLQQPEQETDEINTRAVAARVSAELKRYSVPQAVFAQLVLCRSQGTLSDLLRNPKPWSKLKSGRETFRRMWKWLQEPEYQRMSALRFAGRLAGQ